MPSPHANIAFISFMDLVVNIQLVQCNIIGILTIAEL